MNKQIMDKQIIEYLDKIGNSLEGYGKKGFEVYTHGVFVESAVKIGFGLLLLLLVAVVVTHLLKNIKYGYTNNVSTFYYDARSNEFEIITAVVLFFCALLTVLGVLLVTFSITGMFAPDYVALKEIIGGLK